MKREVSKEVFLTVKNWAEGTDKTLKGKIKQRDIHVGGLYRSIFNRVRESGTDVIYALYFEKHGRFVDMGVGRGVSVEGRATNREIARKRKRKKWYSRTWFGRLHGLTSMVAVRTAETVLEEFKKEI